MRPWQLVVRLDHQMRTMVLLRALTVIALFMTTSVYAASKITSDFNDAVDASLWTPLAGSWTVTGGKYVGIGPNVDQDCPSIVSPTYLNGFSVKDVELEVDLLSPADAYSIDKEILLRSTVDLCSRSEIDLNFRTDPYNDVAVEEYVDNENTLIQLFPIRQPVGKSLHVRIKLVGQHLTVWVNHRSRPVVDQDFNFRLVDSGSVGLGVVFEELVQFDNFRLRIPVVSPPDARRD